MYIYLKNVFADSCLFVAVFWNLWYYYQRKKIICIIVCFFLYGITPTSATAWSADSIFSKVINAQLERKSRRKKVRTVS